MRDCGVCWPKIGATPEITDMNRRHDCPSSVLLARLRATQPSSAQQLPATAIQQPAQPGHSHGCATVRSHI